MTTSHALTPAVQSRALGDLAALRELFRVALGKGADAEDAAWDCACIRTNRFGYGRVEAMAVIAFAPRPIREVINQYADSGHDSRFAVLQSALMAWLTAHPENGAPLPRRGSMQVVTEAIQTHVREAASFAHGACDVLAILDRMAETRLLTATERELQQLIYKAYVAARIAETEAEAQEDGC